MSVSRKVWIEQAIVEKLTPIEVLVCDDSGLHIGHKAAGGAGHFSVRVVSEQFCGLSRVARHRLVFDAVAHLMGVEVHALSISALTPEEV